MDKLAQADKFLCRLLGHTPDAISVKDFMKLWKKGIATIDFDNIDDKFREEATCKRCKKRYNTLRPVRRIFKRKEKDA